MHPLCNCFPLKHDGEVVQWCSWFTGLLSVESLLALLPANERRDHGLVTCQHSTPHVALIKSPKACQEGTLQVLREATTDENSKGRVDLPCPESLLPPARETTKENTCASQQVLTAPTPSDLCPFPLLGTFLGPSFTWFAELTTWCSPEPWKGRPWTQG